ncbi:MAG: GNAT family N-acetyltransferase [Methanocalculaceae archaeon]|jgi:L-amino acid N-acyltransferase YncA|nr:GNAT family N-acetyltransferase [Methanocalculaceae archaeon]
MEIICKPYTSDDKEAVTAIWNEIVHDANAFPQEFPFTNEEGDAFFLSQTATVVAFVNGEVAGCYILHDNNVGRCSHTANASYGVAKKFRGCGTGKVLVSDSLTKAKECGYKSLQYNAVVKSNFGAITLYLKLGFTIIGTIPEGYRRADGMFEDLLIFHKRL